MMNLRGIVVRVEQRLEALGMSAHAASTAAGKLDAVRNLRRAVETVNRQGMATTTLSALAPVLGVSEEWIRTSVDRS
jgi:predicted ATP-grasp superfamily ATP-dependent carboligase